MLREIAIVARYEIVSIVLGVRSLLLVVGYGVIAGGVGALYLWIDRQTNGQLNQIAQKTAELTEAERDQILAQMAPKIGKPLAEAMINGDLPPIVLMVLALSTFAIPGLVLLVGYGSIAEDLSSRFARYILQRVRRESWLIGKISAHFIVSYLAVVLVHVLLLAYATTIDNFDLDKTLPALPRVWAALAFFMLGYAGFTAFFSATISPPFVAFAIGAIALFALWVISFIPNVGQVWMGSWHMQLWALDPYAIAIYAATGLVFGGLAYVGLRRRDV